MRSTKQHSCSHYNAICRDWVANHNRTRRNIVGNSSSKTGSRRQNRKKKRFWSLLKGFLKRQINSAKNANICWQITIAAWMHPFRYDFRDLAAKDNSITQAAAAQIRETPGTTHTGTTIVAKHIDGTKRPQPHPPHTRGTFHRRLQPLYTEKHKVSCSGFLPTTHETFMQPFQCDLQPQLQDTHGTTHTGTTIVAKHIGGTKRPQPHPPHTRGTFHRRLQPL